VPPHPALVPATRQHAAPAVRKAGSRRRPSLRTSSTSQADKDALEKRHRAVAQAQASRRHRCRASISDPVARKLAEWLILRKR